MISITKSYSFSASHRLHSPLLSDQENAAVFGKCNNPHGHGHNYVLSATVRGEVDERTGLIVPVSVLDRLVHEKVLQLFAHRNINVDVPQFRNLVPTTENVAVVIAAVLQEHWGEYLGSYEARLARVHIQETDRNGVEVLLPAVSEAGRALKESELVHA